MACLVQTGFDAGSDFGVVRLPVTVVEKASLTVDHAWTRSHRLVQEFVHELQEARNVRCRRPTVEKKEIGRGI